MKALAGRPVRLISVPAGTPPEPEAVALRERREQLGLSIEQGAAKLGLAPLSLRYLESGAVIVSMPGQWQLLRELYDPRERKGVVR